MNLRNVKRNFPFFLSLFLILSACTKILTTDIGNNLIPPSDNVNTKDTFITVYAKTAGDSVIHPLIGDDHVVGYVNDPLFGKTTAKINVQMVPAFFPYTFNVNADSITHIDSIVLVLHFDGVWGDSTQSLSLHVFEIAGDQQFSRDSIYSSAYSVNPAQELTNGPVVVDPRGLYADSFHVFGGDSGISAIRIPLNISNAGKFLQGYPFDSAHAYQSDSLFNIYFRGLQITSDASGNNLFKINLTNTDTRLEFYYKYKNADSIGVIDTTVSYFSVVSGASAHSNNIVRNRSGAQIAKYYNPSGNNSPSPSNMDSLLFIDANPGVFANINIPGLSLFRNVIIHRAELLMSQSRDPEDNYYYDEYMSPPDLMLAGYSFDSSRRIALYSDLANTSGSVDLTTFGSFPIFHYDPTTPTVEYYSYSFDISRYVQSIITAHDSNYTNLVLYAPFYNEYLYPAETASYPFQLSTVPINSPACGRIRLYGGNSFDSTTRMRLHIVYSTF